MASGAGGASGAMGGSGALNASGPASSPLIIRLSSHRPSVFGYFPG